MKVFVTRDSVCAGDDFDPPHGRTLSVSSTEITDALVLAVLRAYPLPTISGGEATWCLSSIVPLAIVAQQWAQPQMIAPLSLSDCDVRENVLRLHFSYLAQVDPNTTFDIVRRLRLTARE